MILSDRDIHARLRKGDLVIHPIANMALQVQPASVDLRLDQQFLYQDRTQLIIKEPGTFAIAPGEFVLASTIERVVIPHDLAARVEGRSSLGRLGIVVHATAGFIDPGFDGQITLEISNLGKLPVELKIGSRVCQIVFHQLSSPCQNPYGPARGSKYSNQVGVTGSKIEEDM